MHRCEALVSQQSAANKAHYMKVVFVPCGKEDAELHHKLTRARGGHVLDKAGETYHHIWLCREHHNVAHDQGSAFQNGLLIAGSVITGPNGTPVYTGPDEYLSERYGAA